MRIPKKIAVIKKKKRLHHPRRNERRRVHLRGSLRAFLYILVESRVSGADGRFMCPILFVFGKTLPRTCLKRLRWNRSGYVQCIRFYKIGRTRKYASKTRIVHRLVVERPTTLVKLLRNAIRTCGQEPHKRVHVPWHCHLGPSPSNPLIFPKPRKARSPLYRDRICNEILVLSTNFARLFWIYKV